MAYISSSPLVVPFLLSVPGLVLLITSNKGERVVVGGCGGQGVRRSEALPEEGSELLDCLQLPLKWPGLGACWRR